MFHDGRTMLDDSAPYDIRMPDGFDLERPLPSALAAQVILPMLSAEEMAGQGGENPVAMAVAKGAITGTAGAWDIIAGRVAAIPDYRQRIEWLNGGQGVHISDLAQALADFIAFEFRATNSPFDAYLAGDQGALTPQAQRGMDLFYGDAGCAACHAGPFQTDHGFHAIGMPQLGPGKEGKHGPQMDRGRQYVTGDPEDRYRFRTPSLRNVALTAPYGHSGAYATLDQVVRHHLSPHAALLAYDPASVALPGLDGTAPEAPTMPGPDEIARIAAAVELEPVALTEDEIADILAFLTALTDPGTAIGRLGAPTHVPSGLPVDRPPLH
jgi:cytochrome c peroxidase